MIDTFFLSFCEQLCRALQMVAQFTYLCHVGGFLRHDCPFTDVSVNVTLFHSAPSSISEYKDSVSVLERDGGAAWKLVFKLLAKGRLYDNEKEKPLQITGNGLVRENRALFADTYGN